MLAPLSTPVLGLLVALGCGLLIGLDRERHKGEGDDRRAAGIRSFTVACVSGALAQSLGQSLGQSALVAVGASMVALLAVVSHATSRSRDPGLTTELALFATYLVGVQAVQSPALGAACGAGLAVLLASRQRLHRFATRVLTAHEWHDGLVLAALGLVVLPLIPAVPLAWLGGINPRPLAAMVLLILLLQALGHVALRLLGPSRGLALSGFFSGFVSSTATIASLGSRARADATLTGPLASAAVLSSAATWVQVMLMAVALSPSAAGIVAPATLAGLLVALAVGAALLVWSPGPARGAEPATTQRSALRLRVALLVATLLAVVALAVSQAQRYFGQTGVLASVALSGLADAHAPVASLAALHAAGALTPHELMQGVLYAVSTNCGTRGVVAFVTGGCAFGWRVGTGLAAGLAAAWAGALWLGPL